MSEKPWLASASSLHDLDVCETLFVERHKERVEAPSSEAMLLGKAFHAGSAEFWRGNNAGIVAATAAFGSPYPVSAMLAHYVHLYTPLREESEVLAVEQDFELGGVFRGKIDLVLRRPQLKKVQVVEHKTTGASITGVWQEQWQHSEQAAAYLEYGKTLLREGEELEFVLDAVQVPRKGSLVKPEHFAWYEFEYDEELLTELRWVRKQKVATAQALQSGAGAALPLRNTGSCVRFGRLCEFAPLCFGKPSDRDARRLGMLATGELQRREEHD